MIARTTRTSSCSTRWMNTGWGNEDQPARYEALLEVKTGRNWYRMFTQEFGDSSANGKGHLILSVYPIDAVSRIAITPSDGLRELGPPVRRRSLSMEGTSA